MVINKNKTKTNKGKHVEYPINKNGFNNSFIKITRTPEPFEF